MTRPNLRDLSLTDLNDFIEKSNRLLENAKNQQEYFDFRKSIIKPYNRMKNIRVIIDLECNIENAQKAKEILKRNTKEAKNLGLNQ